MTDTSTLVPNQMGISSDCQYNLKPSSVRARSYRASISPTNKSVFNPSDTIISYVPGGRKNTYLDTSQSYIRFTIKNNDTTASSSSQNTFFYLDNNASCIFNRLDVFHSSNLIESVQSYNQLMTIYMDTNVSSSQKLGLSAAYGTASTVGTSTTPSSFVASQAFTSTDISRLGTPIYGTAWNSALGTPATQTVAQQQTFCMPVLSGTIGLGAEKFLPLGKLSDDIRLEFTLETQNTAVVYNRASSTAAWSVVDFQLELAIVELSDEGEAMVNQYLSPENPIYIHGVSWRHYTSTLPASTSGGVSFLVPARFGSLKNLFVCPRRSTEITNAQGYSLSSRINPNFAQYWWRVGSALLPAKYVTLENASNTGAYAEAFMELQKTFHSVSTPANASVLPAIIYNVGDSGSVTFTNSASVSPSSFTTGVQPIQIDGQSYRNGFLIGQELESFALRSDLLLSGYNTLSQQVFFEAQINTAIGATPYTLNFFASFDQILVIENGIMSVRF
jgi:hypothetical protein